MSKKELQKLVSIIGQKFSPEKIILFGSFAWGKPHPDSDLDLFIVQETKQPRFAREREIRQSLFGQNFPPTDILVYTPQELKNREQLGDPFILKIINEGRVLYES